MTNQTIISNIKNILRSQNKDLGALCNELSITRQSLHARLYGNITIKNLQQIADVLGVHITELLKDTDPDNPATTINNTSDFSGLVCPHCGGAIQIKIISADTDTTATNE